MNIKDIIGMYMNGMNNILKEEPEVVKQLGEFAGKFIAAETAKQARKIVVGG